MKDDSHGRELHREFVGMLFALAIAEVAIRAADLSNSGLSFAECLPAYAHLFLGTMIIATSWVGWGWSKHSLSNIKNVFSRDFLELLVDLWLVIVYFLIVKGVDVQEGVFGRTLEINPSIANESKWIMAIFGTYLIWDFITKGLEESAPARAELVVVGPRTGQARGWLLRDDRDRPVIIQRGWASLACAALAFVAYWNFDASLKAPEDIVFGDICLLMLVLLFRAMKLRDLSDIPRSFRTIALILLLFVAFLLFFSGTIDTNSLKSSLGDWIDRNSTSISSALTPTPSHLVFWR